MAAAADQIARRNPTIRSALQRPRPPVVAVATSPPTKQAMPHIEAQHHQCPLMAISRHSERCVRESALPPKADIQMRKNGYDSKSGHLLSALPPKADVNGCGAGCPLMTQSGHGLSSQTASHSNPTRPFLSSHGQEVVTDNDCSKPDGTTAGRDMPSHDNKSAARILEG